MDEISISVYDYKNSMTLLDNDIDDSEKEICQEIIGKYVANELMLRDRYEKYLDIFLKYHDRYQLI